MRGYKPKFVLSIAAVVIAILAFVSLGISLK